jgi:hypothetical protein
VKIVPSSSTKKCIDQQTQRPHHREDLAGGRLSEASHRATARAKSWRGTGA